MWRRTDESCRPFEVVVGGLTGNVRWPHGLLIKFKVGIFVTSDLLAFSTLRKNIKLS